LRHDITRIELSGLKKLRFNMGLYKNDKEFNGLRGTFCSALVHCTYSSNLFSFHERKLLDLWMRLLFANDHDRDESKTFETPEQVISDNKKMMGVVSDGDPSTYRKANAMKWTAKQLQKTIATEIKKNQSLDVLPDVQLPDYFYNTLQHYFDSTVNEAILTFNLEQPSLSELEVVKQYSSGSEHAIAMGAVLKNLDRDALLNNFILKILEEHIEKAVEGNNDINYCSKETLIRIKKLVEILQMIDKHFDALTSYIDEGTPLAIINTDHQFLVNFYRKAQQVLSDPTLDKSSPKDVLLALLHLVPSFNSVDLYVSKGYSYKESYKIIAKRANGMIKEAVRNIRQFREFTENDIISIPRAFTGRREEFLRQAEIFMRISAGWAAQNCWELVIPRYSPGMPLEDAYSAAQRYVAFCKQMREVVDVGS